MMLAQLLGGRGARLSRQLDRLYLRRQSLLLDAQIIALSAAVNIVGKQQLRRWLRPALRWPKTTPLPQE